MYQVTYLRDRGDNGVPVKAGTTLWVNERLYIKLMRTGSAQLLQKGDPSVESKAPQKAVEVAQDKAGSAEAEQKAKPTVSTAAFRPRGRSKKADQA